MKRYAFSLLELIFVVVLIGILAGIGASSFRTNYLVNDINFIAMKIRRAQFEGIGYETRTFGGGHIATDKGCVTLSENALKDDINASGGMYALHVTLDATDFNTGEVCFDAKGQPHDGDHASNLLAVRKVLKVRYRSHEANITIEPLSGYVIVDY